MATKFLGSVINCNLGDIKWKSQRGCTLSFYYAALLYLLLVHHKSLAPAQVVPTDVKVQEVVTLTLGSWRTEDGEGYAKMFAIFEKSHPNIKINFEPT